MWKLLKRMIREKRVPCNHKWYHVQDTFIINNYSSSIDTDSADYIYCPKCKYEDLVYRKEWERIKRRQEIDESIEEELV